MIAGILSGILLLACGDDTQTSGSGGGGGGGGAGGSGGTGGEAATVSMTFEVRGLTGTLLDGVEICVEGANPANCATTDATGEAVLRVPASSEIAFRSQKASFVTSLLPIETGTVDIGTFRLFAVPEAGLAGLAQAFGVTLDPTKGTVGILHAGQAATGAAASLAPASGEGPFYFDATFTPQPQGTELPQGGGALFFNVNPGSVTTSFAPAAEGCAFGSLAWGTAAGSTTTPVEANALSVPPNIFCE